MDKMYKLVVKETHKRDVEEKIRVKIDSDELAEAIVKANKSAKKEKGKGKIRTVVMRFFNGMTFATVYVLAGFSIYATWSEAYSKNNATLVGCIVLSVAFLIIGIYAFLCQLETFDDNESDTFEFFNTNVSLIALIVALIALFKGVG